MKRESGERKGKAEQSHIAGQIIDTLRKNKPSLLLFLSSAECRTVAEVIVPIVNHKAGRNVWPALWETPLQSSQLSQPGDLNSATESSMVSSWQREICFLLKDGKL